MLSKCFRFIVKEAHVIIYWRTKFNYERISSIVKYSSKSNTMARVLNVAEKNDAAKSIAEIMSRGSARRREGKSVYNKIYEFEYNLFNQRCRMVMTSVSGHLLNLEFTGSYKKWQMCDPIALFEAPVVRACQPDFQGIKLTLEDEVRNCRYLIIWTDGDREGENIGFEIIEVCTKIQPNIQVLRARFSEITHQAISRACANLEPPNKRMSDAVNVRIELDLRIGASFTRFQTLRLQRVFPEVLSNQLISYGSCQFPTLGFVVERYKQVQAFISEAFWKIKVTHKKEDVSTEFSWKRGRLFDHTACLVLYQVCLEAPSAQVVDIRSRNKNKWRPQPLDTVEFEKLSSRKLRINAKEAMSIAEKLYTKGYISYPRTETTIFPKELNLTSLVEIHCEDPNWGAFAQRVLEWGPNPRQGTKTDNAHPPIHPTKYINTLQGNDKSVYELIVRHFLACVSKDAEGQETTVEIDVNAERFAVNGLMIIARNYLDVYPYERWNAKIIGEYTLNEVFRPSAIEMSEGETSAPDLLTEADLIGLMEKHGIGTDATHAEHIERIKSRLYVGVNENGRFVPGELGMGLVEGYDLMGLHMSKPHLRAELEADLKRITDGSREPAVVLTEQVSKYKQYFVEVARQAMKLDSALSTYFNVTPEQPANDNIAAQPMPIMKCPKCQTGDIVLRTKRDNRGFFLSCMSYPDCNAVMWLPESLEQISVMEEDCPDCRPRRVKKVKLKFKTGSLRPFYPDQFENCLGGCDSDLMMTLDVHPITSARIATSTTNSSRTSSDSGYDSTHFSNTQNRSNSTSSRTQPRAQTNANQTRQQTNANQSRQTNANQQWQQTNVNPHRTAPSSFTSSQQSSRLPFQPVPTSSNTSSRPIDDVVCNCGKKAIVLIVRRDGPNKGREFYKCPEPQGGTQCDFFLWKDDGVNISSNQTRTTIRPSNNNSWQPSTSFSNENSRSSGVPQCTCNQDARIMTVRKEGANQGRQFYSCSKPYGSGHCGFFKWVDPDESNGNQSTHFPNNNSGGASNMFRAGPSHKRPSSSASGGSSNKRKCGICNQPGHNRKKCPQNR